jgi:DNA repair protein RadB
METTRVHTGSHDLDTLLGGGLERRVVTQFYGEPGSGKSTLSILCAVECLKSGKSVIFIDSEGFSIERFRQVAGPGGEVLAEHLYLYEPLDFREQGAMIGDCETILRSREVGLIVLDSITALYRSELSSGGEAQRHLAQQVLRLLGYAKRYQIPVIVTNQVYMDIDRDRVAGLGGTALQHISKVIVRVEKKDGHRRAVLEKHRSQPEGLWFDFALVEEGIRGL